VPRRRTPLPDWIHAAQVDLGHRIATLRHVRKLSQEQLADRCGLERRSIQRYENAVRAPGLPELLLIAHALDVPVARLFEALPVDSDRGEDRGS
jgi:transcriptional regulator with XRE-family HTH domain